MASCWQLHEFRSKLCTVTPGSCALRGNRQIRPTFHDLSLLLTVPNQCQIKVAKMVFYLTLSQWSLVVDLVAQSKYNLFLQSLPWQLWMHRHRLACNRLIVLSIWGTLQMSTARRYRKQLYMSVFYCIDKIWKCFFPRRWALPSTIFGGHKAFIVHFAQKSVRSAKPCNWPPSLSVILEGGWAVGQVIIDKVQFGGEMLRWASHVEIVECVGQGCQMVNKH